jgi:hypothetical protein
VKLKVVISSVAYKKYIKDFGVWATLKIIKETLFAPWLWLSGHEEQMQITLELRL